MPPKVLAGTVKEALAAELVASDEAAKRSIEQAEQAALDALAVAACSG